MNGRKRVVLGLDVGTTNIKALAIDEAGTPVAESALPIATHAPRPGWVEQNPETILATAVDCVRNTLAKAGREAVDAIALGIANQTETLVVWDRRTGRSALPAIVWQCRRGAEEIEPLGAPETLSRIRARTGLDLDPTFTAAKLKWVTVHRPDLAEGLRSGAFLFGTVDTWLIWSLTGGRTYATEPSNASRTMLFDIDSRRFDRELLSLFDLAMAELPDCRPSNASFGATDASIFGAPIPIHAALGDQQASLFGHGCFGEGQLKITYGTGAFLWVNAGAHPREAPAPGIIRTLAWDLDRPCYAFEGFVMYAGKILDWLSSRLAVEGGASGVAQTAERVGASEGVVLVPAFQGLASPWWRPDVRAAILGMSEASTVGHIAHAGLEAVCHQVRAVLEPVRKALGESVPEIRIDGGLTRSAYFSQLQADALQLPLHRCGSGSVAALGAALMAGLGAGVWRSLEELKGMIPGTETIRPDPAAAPRLDEAYAEWLATIAMLSARPISPKT